MKRGSRGGDSDTGSSPPRSAPHAALTARVASASVRKPFALSSGPGGGMPVPYAASFSPEFGFAHHASSSSSGSGLPGPIAGPSRGRSPVSLLAWSRLAGEAGDMRGGGDSCSTGTEEDGSTHSLW